MFSNEMQNKGSATEVFLCPFRRAEDLEKLRGLTSPRSHHHQACPPDPPDSICLPTESLIDPLIHFLGGTPVVLITRPRTECSWAHEGKPAWMWPTGWMSAAPSVMKTLPFYSAGLPDRAAGREKHGAPSVPPGAANQTRRA